MWIVWSETIEVAGVFLRLVSFDSHLDRENPDEILIFETVEESNEFDWDKYSNEFDWYKFMNKNGAQI